MLLVWCVVHSYSYIPSHVYLVCMLVALCSILGAAFLTLCDFYNYKSASNYNFKNALYSNKISMEILLTTSLMIYTA